MGLRAKRRDSSMVEWTSSNILNFGQCKDLSCRGKLTDKPNQRLKWEGTLQCNEPSFPAVKSPGSSD